MAEPIKYESALPGLIQLLGQKSTGSSGSSTSGSSTTTGTANIDPLTQIFSASMGNAGMGIDGYQQLLTSIFQEGSKQVPALIGAYANATGSRTSNNSGLQLALGDLNRQMSTQAMQAILQNQQQNLSTANAAAGNIAQATKSTTQTNTGTQQGNNTSKQTVANPNAGYGTMLGGFLLNQADKRGWLDMLKTGTSNMFGGAPATNYAAVDPAAYPDAYGSGMDPFAGQAPMTMDAPFNYGMADTGGSFGDMGMEMSAPFASYGFDSGGFGGGDATGYDATSFDMGGGSDPFTSNGFDPGWFDTPAADLDFFSGGFDLGFANGGMVNPRMRPRGYADGGVVGRKHVNIAAERAFDSGGDQVASPPLGAASNPSGEFDFFRKTPARAVIVPPQEEYQPSNSLGPRIIRSIRGYANGGVVNRAPAYLVSPTSGRMTQFADPRSLTFVPDFGQQLADHNRSAASNPKADRFADGGIVRNRAYLGQRESPVKSAAMNYRPQQEMVVDEINNAANPAMAGTSTPGITSDMITGMASRFSEAGGIGGSARGGRPELMPNGRPGAGNRPQGPAPENAGSSGVGDGMATGQVGTVAENAAAVNGFGVGIVSAITGLPAPAINMALNALGIPSTPISPLTGFVNAITQAFSGNSSNGSEGGVSPASVSAATGVSNANEGGLGGMGVTMGLDAGFDSTGQSGGFANVGVGVSTDGMGGTTDGGIGGDGSVGTGTGDSPGNDGSGAPGGDGGGGAVGGDGGYKSGGRVRGVGTSTSDSIRVAAKDPGGADIRYSDSEFVIPAEVIRMTGAQPWEQLVAAFNLPKQ